jgi:hypothetical protein
MTPHNIVVFLLVFFVIGVLFPSGLNRTWYGTTGQYRSYGYGGVGIIVAVIVILLLLGKL